LSVEAKSIEDHVGSLPMSAITVTRLPPVLSPNFERFCNTFYFLTGGFSAAAFFAATFPEGAAFGTADYSRRRRTLASTTSPHSSQTR
jgi:hypothetical protein